MLARYRVTRRDVKEVLLVNQQAVGQWATGVRRMTPEHALKIEALLAIPRWELRPDLWPKPGAKAPRRRRRPAKPVGAQVYGTVLRGRPGSPQSGNAASG